MSEKKWLDIMDIDYCGYNKYVDVQNWINDYFKKELGEKARFDGIYSPCEYFKLGRKQSRIVIVLKETWEKEGGKRWDPVDNSENDYSIKRHPKNKVASKLVKNLADYFGNVYDEEAQQVVLRGIGYVNISKKVNISKSGKSPKTNASFIKEQIEKHFDSMIVPQIMSMIPDYVFICGIVGKHSMMHYVTPKLEKAYGVKLHRKAIKCPMHLELNEYECPIKKISLWQGVNTPLFIQTYHPTARGNLFYPTSKLLEILDNNQLIDWNVLHKHN